MKNYAYVMQVLTPHNVYEITGDARRVSGEADIVPLALANLAQESGEELGSLVVVEFSCVETTS